MWDLLKKADIDQAKSELVLRRAATLRRHADESEALDANRLELEKLNKLIDVFLQKFPRPVIISHAPISPPPAQPHTAQPHTPQHHGAQHHAAQPHAAQHPAVQHHAASKAVHEPKHHSHRHLPQTSFATYMRAASRV
jgi:hypothetical protein